MEEKINSNIHYTRINSKKLIELLKNPTDEVLKIEAGKREILFEAYEIEDKYIIIYGDFEISYPLTFRNCKFKSEYIIYMDHMICNKELTFENCSFLNSLFFQGGVFKKEVLFKYTDLENNEIHFTNCNFEKLNISCYNVNELFFSDTKFQSLRIGDHLSGNHIKELIIFTKANEVGDIFIAEQNFEKIYLSGSNKDHEFNFSKIKCNNISIKDFKNEGSLNFYGIEPIVKNIGYFEIFNSNLDNAQFYRASFSDYKELIIIDSFITDTLFLGCKWSNNIRAISGPGTRSFDKSLLNGRKISSNENIAIREAYRQLKISMSNHSDKIQENRFYAQELVHYNKTLKWSKPWKDNFWDKIILYLSKFFSGYGQSFFKPLIWLLLGHFILFIIAIVLDGFAPLCLSWSDASEEAFRKAFEKYFIYINPLRKLETTLSGYLIALDLSMRIWSSYMIYNIIRASRRFIS
jgi:uncharacterized protein YjbI with pentapeptide repeats